MSRRILYLGTALLIALGTSILSMLPSGNPATDRSETDPSPTQTSPTLTDTTPLYEVVHVIDGDTIIVRTDRGEQKVRYIGIDTPEIGECLGDAATERNIALVAGKSVRLEKDVSETDRHGRWLRYVYVDTVFVNETLVSEGYAKAFSYPPDIQQDGTLQTALRDARQADRGIWSSTCL